MWSTAEHRSSQITVRPLFKNHNKKNRNEIQVHQSRYQAIINFKEVQHTPYTTSSLNLTVAVYGIFVFIKKIIRHQPYISHQSSTVTAEHRFSPKLFTNTSTAEHRLSPTSLPATYQFSYQAIRNLKEVILYPKLHTNFNA